MQQLLLRRMPEERCVYSKLLFLFLFLYFLFGVCDHPVLYICLTSVSWKYSQRFAQQFIPVFVFLLYYRVYIISLLTLSFL